MLPTHSTGHGAFNLKVSAYCAAKELYTGEQSPQGWINDYDCCLRMTFGPTNGFNRHDAWPIESDDHIIRQVMEALECGLSVLDRFVCAEDLLTLSEEEKFKLEGIRQLIFEPPLPVLKTCIHLSNNQFKEAQTLISDYITKASETMPGHAETVQKWAVERRILTLQ